MKRSNYLQLILLVMAFVLVGPALGTVRAQSRQSVPKPTAQEPGALSDAEVRQLISMMDTNKNGKISKQEWMNFMSAEFDRLDTDKSGEIDPKELTASSLRPSTFSSAGK